MSIIQKEVLTSRKKSLSIVIPTYNESKNIVKILDSLRLALTREMNAEIIVVDDNSPDGTSNTVEEYVKNSKNSSYSIQIIRREDKRGLSSAIVTGIEHAKGDAVVVMDSDLSHPPQTIPQMVEELQNSDCDIVVASRYVKGGSVSGWPFKRKLISKGATKIAQHGLGIKIKDPMSGFFAFKRHIVNNIKFDAIGYKILLEILVKARGAKVKEIPLQFGQRESGASKIEPQTAKDILLTVIKLRWFDPFTQKFLKFGTVGFTGYLINAILLQVIANNTHIEWLAWLVSTQLAICSNFTLNNLWTFRSEKITGFMMLLKKFLLFNFTSAGALLIQVVAGTVGTSIVGASKRQILLPFIIVFMVLPYNWIMYNKVIWKNKK